MEWNDRGLRVLDVRSVVGHLQPHNAGKSPNPTTRVRVHSCTEVRGANQQGECTEELEGRRYR